MKIFIQDNLQPDQYLEGIPNEYKSKRQYFLPPEVLKGLLILLFTMSTFSLTGYGYTSLQNNTQEKVILCKHIQIYCKPVCLIGFVEHIEYIKPCKTQGKQRFGLLIHPEFNLRVVNMQNNKVTVSKWLQGTRGEGETSEGSYNQFEEVAALH